jgi:hypothetical protein
MKNFGPLYVDKLKYYHKKALPIVEVGNTIETEWPYRRSLFCLVFRIPFTIPGYIVGVWRKPEGIILEEDVDSILAEALNLRNMGTDAEDIREW